MLAVRVKYATVQNSINSEKRKGLKRQQMTIIKDKCTKIKYLEFN